MRAVRTPLLIWLPAFLWAATLFYLSSRPAGPEPGCWLLANDKLDHAVAYALLALLVYLPVRLSRLRPTRAAFVAVLVASLYGVTDEFHQRFVPTRTPDVFDWLADTGGAAAAALGAAFLTRHGTRPPQPEDCPSRPAD